MIEGWDIDGRYVMLGDDTFGLAVRDYLSFLRDQRQPLLLYINGYRDGHLSNPVIYCRSQFENGNVQDGEVLKM